MAGSSPAWPTKILLQPFVNSSSKKFQSKKILLIRLDRFGDLLMNVPVIHRAKENFPNAHITVLCQDTNQALLENHPFIDKLQTISLKNFNKLSVRMHLIKEWRAAKYDWVIIPAPMKALHVMAFLSGIPVRIGFDRKWGGLLTHRLKDRKGEGVKHEIDYNLELLDKLCPTPWSGHLDLGFERRMPDIDGKQIVFHITTSNSVKQWPLNSFKEVIDQLLVETDHHIVFVGAEESTALTHFIQSLRPKLRITNFIGQTSLDQLAVILNQADLVVSLDSGPYHLAWMQKVPVVGLFLKEAVGSNPTRWGVYPGFVEHQQLYGTSAEITPEKVVQTIRTVFTK